MIVDRRMPAVVLAALFLLISTAMPAAADTTAKVTITGSVEVGKWFSEHCGSDGVATVTGRGLYLPRWPTFTGFWNGNREEHSVFHLRASNAPAMVLTNQQGSPPHLTPMLFEVCGYMSPEVDFTPDDRTDGIGASCGGSRGHDGRGWLGDTTTGELLQLQDLGWHVAVGGSLVMTGRYVEMDESTGELKRKEVLVDPDGSGKGGISALLQFQGGAPCLGFKFLPFIFNNGNGAQTFTVTGTIAVGNKVGGGIHHGDKCKEDGVPAGVGADGKKSHANKLGTDDCPGKPA